MNSTPVDAQRETNTKLAARNSMLDAEVLDLKQGYEAIEERHAPNSAWS